MNQIKQQLNIIGDWCYYKTLSYLLRDCRSVLDVGCGSWSPLAFIKKHFYSEGIDIYKPSLNKIKKTKIHDRYRLGDVKKIGRYYRMKSFDAVVALDLIEHLSKKDGRNLIKQMGKIARKKVIILTPNGFTHQDAFEGNPYQIHRSGWTVKDFEKLAYKVQGMRGLKLIRGNQATIKYHPWFFWGLLSFLSQFIVYFFPAFAYQLLAIKIL